jgi:hypothetical protein
VSKVLLLLVQLARAPQVALPVRDPTRCVKGLQQGLWM